MIVSCPRCDHRFEGGASAAAACPACHLVFHPGDDLLDVHAPESYLEAQTRAVRGGPEPAVRAACHAHPDTDALARCAGCARPICSWCNVTEAGAPQCETCFFNDVVAARAEAPSTPSELLKRGFDPRQPIQWELRSSLGVRDSLQRTWRDVMLQPAHFFQHMPLAGDTWSPLIFAVSWATLGLLLWRVWRIGWLVLTYRRAVDLGLPLFLGTPYGSRTFWSSLGTEVVIVLLIPLIALTMYLAEVAILQTLLMLVGEKHARVRITWRLVGYAAAPWALLLVPGVGLPLALVTHLGVLATALRQGYHLGAGRAWLVSAAPYALGGTLWYAPTLQAWAQAGYRFFFGG